MNKMWIIAFHEFTTRVRNKSFIIITLITPFIIAAIAAVPFILGQIGNDGQKTVMVHDATGHYISLFKNNESYAFVPMSDTDFRNYNSNNAVDSPAQAVVDIKADLAANPKAASIVSKEQVPTSLTSYITDVLNEQVRKDKLAQTGIESLDSIITDIQSSVEVATYKQGEDGNVSFSNTEIAIACGFLFTTLIYMFVMCYGAMVLQSVSTEKTNRIIELMISSVKPFQLMMGKIIGMAFVGFAQLALWAALFSAIITIVGAVTGISFFAGGQMDSAIAMQQMAGGATASVSTIDPQITEMIHAVQCVPWVELIVMFIVYFVGGYLLYASYFAAVGASVNESQDSSQFMLPVTLVMLFGFYAALGSAENTDGPLAFWTSMIPLTSPIVMMIRIPFNVPLWQEILSVALLYGTAFFTIWTSGRIYRVGILMYGKKPTFKELAKWITYK